MWKPELLVPDTQKSRRGNVFKKNNLGPGTQHLAPDFRRHTSYVSSISSVVGCD